MIRPGHGADLLDSEFHLSHCGSRPIAGALAAGVGATGPIEAWRTIVEFGPEPAAFRVCGDVDADALRQVYIPYRDATTQQTDFGEGRVQILSHALRRSEVRWPPAKRGYWPSRVPGASRVCRTFRLSLEAGFPEMEIEGLTGLFGWRDMPPALRDRISADVRAVAGDPSVRSRIEAGGQQVLGSTPNEFSAAIERQRIAHSADQPHRRFEKCGEIARPSSNQRRFK